METAFTWIAAFSAALGLIALLLIWRRWSWVARYYQEHWPKTIVSFFRLLAAVVALLAKPTPFNPNVDLLAQPWWWATILVVMALLAWECVGHWGDSKHKAAKEKTATAYKDEIAVLTQDRDEAEQLGDHLLRLLTTLREMTQYKLQRMRRTIAENRRVNASLVQTRAGLDPEEQIHIILESLVSQFRFETTTTIAGYNQNFRVGLFCEDNGCLRPIAAFDLTTKSHAPFSSYRDFEDRYRLNNDVNPSQAVRCVVEGRMLIIPDCAVAQGFEFFTEPQRGYLRSMVACPLADFCLDGITPIRSALIVDTNIPGFFLEEDREMIELHIKEFAVSLSLEYTIQGLIRRANPEGG